MDYQIKEFECFGRIFFRVLVRRASRDKYWGPDVWELAPGTLDYDQRADAERKVEELNASL